MTEVAGASWAAIASLFLGVLNLGFIVLTYLRTKRVKPNELEDMVDRRLGRKELGDSSVLVRRAVFEPEATSPLKSLLSLWQKYPAGQFIIQAEFPGETSEPPFSESEFTGLCDHLDIQAVYNVEEEVEPQNTTSRGVVLNFHVEETDPRTLDKFVDGLLQLVSNEV